MPINSNNTRGENMLIKRLGIIAVCTALGFAAAGQSDLVFAKNKNKTVPASQVANGGYPNGRPFQAIESDFVDVKQRIAQVKADTETILVELDQVLADNVVIKSDLTQIKATLAQIQTGLVAIGSGVASLTNTLDVQVSVAPASADQRNDLNDAPVQVFVQVTQNGVGVTGLTAADFEYSNSFPVNGAAYCGDACFMAGENGLYGIELQGVWSAAPYAGTLKVHATTSTPDGDVTANGSSLVNFEIPAAPAP
jgi:hypothetical protein